jgi:hypothetical protein
MGKIMKYFIDIDNTICKTEDDDYENAQPYLDRIKKINDLYEQGHEIIYMTARGAETGINWEDLTKKQLKEWGCKYKSFGLKKGLFRGIKEQKEYVRQLLGVLKKENTEGQKLSLIEKKF